MYLIPPKIHASFSTLCLSSKLYHVMSSMRQRRGPSPSRESLLTVSSTSTPWEIASATSVEVATDSAVPMYNPTQFKSSLVYDDSSSSSLPPPALSTSRRVSWNTIMDAKNNISSDNIREESIPNNNYHQLFVHQPASTRMSSSKKDGGYTSLMGGRNLSPLTPTMVPDSSYRAHLMGRGHDTQDKSGSMKIQIANFFGYFSIAGFVFLTFIGILIDTQPMFLQGVMPKNVRYVSGKSQTFYATDIKDRLEPATHAYRGAILYLLCAIFCLSYANNAHWFLFKKRWQQYRDIDDLDSAVSTFRSGVGSNNEYLPTNGTIHQQAYGEQHGYIAQMWHSTSIRCQRFGIYLESIWQARRRNRRRFAGAKDV